MSKDLMKTIFKVFNVLIIVVNVISFISVFKNYSKAAPYEKNIIGLTAVFSFLILLAILYMAYSGLKGNYSTCKKFAIGVLILTSIGMVAESFAGSAILSVIFAAAYLFLCIALDSRY